MVWCLHDVCWRPEHGVAVGLERGVEGEEVALLAAVVRAAVAVDVGLHAPLPSPPAAQELEVQLVVRLLVHIPIRQLHDRTKKSKKLLH
jgi:hypothetical protein